MEYQKVSSASFSKKLTKRHSHSFSGTSIYDGVFSGPMKVASYIEEDYGEIFGGSRSSSIPVLDVPELNERKITVDVKSSKLDYSKIFGGFREFDFAVSHEELSGKSKKKDSFVQEARTAAETGSYPPNFSVENKVLPREASYQSIDGVKEFKMSYHKANQERRNETTGTTHVTQLHAVPGYTCLIDGFSPSRMTEGDKPLSSALNGTHLNNNFSGELREGKHSRKASPVPSPGGARKQGSRDGVKFQSKYNHSRSSSNDMLFEECESGPRTHPSKVPLPSSLSDSYGNNRGAFNTSMGSKMRASKSNSFEDAAGFCSPPYFEEEVDTNSVAAASAAAVLKAIEEAQARIKMAKEIMERKKDGLQDHVKMRFNDGPKTEERREGKLTDKTNKFSEEVRRKCAKDDAPMQVFGSSRMQNAKKAGEIPPDFRERDDLFVAIEAPAGTQGDKHNSTLMDHGQEEMKDLKADKGEGIETKVQSAKNFELKERILTMKMFEQPDENSENFKAFEEPHIQEEVERNFTQEEVEKKLNTVQGACEFKEGAYEQKSGQGAHDQGEYGKKLLVTGLQDEKEVTFKAVHGVEACEKKQRKQWERNANETKLKILLEEQEEGRMKPMVAVLQEEKEVTFKATLRVEAHQKKQRRLWAPNANENKLLMQELKDNEHMKIRLLKDEQVWLENEKKQKEVLEQKETVIRSEDVLEREENGAELSETSDYEENGKRSGVTCDNVESEKQQKEGCGLEVNDEEQEGVNGREGAEKTSAEALEQETVKVRINEFLSVEQSGKKLEEHVGLGAKERLLEAEENEPMLKQANQMGEIEKRLRESCEVGETENLQTEIDQREEDVKMKVTQEACDHFKNNLEAAYDIYTQDKIEIQSETLEASIDDVNNECLEVPSHEESGRVMEGIQASSEYKEMETEAIVVDLANDQEEEGIFEVETADIAQVLFEHDVIEKQVKDATEAQAFEYIGLNVGVSGMGVEELASESEEKFEDAEEVEGSINLGKDESDSESSNQERLVDNGENMESTEMTQNTQTSQSTEQYEENHSESLKTEGMEVEGTMQKEVELQKEWVEKIDLAKEKEIEREKERIAVERAIREARERAFTEAREKAERVAVQKANAEARRRAMTEAREMLEKASGEVNHKSSTDKTSVEARLKAERAAVERATAEARMRALEKAISDKAASKGRNQAVKSSGPYRENGMRNGSASNDSLSKRSGPTKGSRSSNYSSHDEKFDGVNGEPVQRHKARLESHQRIAERAAKALAEKNMRDLLAQKEQAERNRLAEALDADVKRWSRGKAGNLRALLSTLQYILGPDSGWQPIPLTDLIATAAVKKAYKKATLVVHPDKLQQRGASIQQKYTCEKVFDLLKEAWNRFNAEER